MTADYMSDWEQTHYSPDVTLSDCHIFRVIKKNHSMEVES